ncbi:MAG TPA: DUF4920 domain-containing protein [Polyangiaceae bacterium]|nr:DUF4920 domain-containing protein [Polyangiaceae bacterium]
MHIFSREITGHLRLAGFAAGGMLLGVLSLCSACGRPAESTGTETAPGPGASAPSARSSTERTAATPGAAAPVSPASASPATFGEKITASIVPLAEIAAHPSRFQNEVVATSGKVTAVCQERGCWMELADASGQAHVRMHGHSFFVPRTAPGHTARVQARLVPARGGMNCENPAQGAPMDCENTEKDPSGTARVELDATGVEID